MNGTGKLPDGQRDFTGNAAPPPIVNVEPPRREDLQPRYAEVLSADDGDGHGWYGAMSESDSSLMYRFHYVKAL